MISPAFFFDAKKSSIICEALKRIEFQFSLWALGLKILLLTAPRFANFDFGSIFPHPASLKSLKSFPDFLLLLFFFLEAPVVTVASSVLVFILFFFIIDNFLLVALTK